jgi:hypothetical protein
MKPFLGAFVLSFAVTLVGDAQYEQTTTKTKIKIEDGKNVTVVGCLQRSADETGFTLSNLTGDATKTPTYLLVPMKGGEDDLDELAQHLGHKIEVQGKAVDTKDGEVEIETRTKVDVEDGKDRETKSKTKIEGDLAGLPFLGVKDVKMIAKTCP